MANENTSAEDNLPGEGAPVAGAQRALMNLVLLAHAEIRALRDLVALLLPPEGADTLVHAGNWAGLEAEFRRKHLEALGLSAGVFDALLSEEMIAQAQAGRDGGEAQGGERT